MDKDIAEYYLKSPLFINITQNENFKNMTIEELLTSDHAQYPRDDSEIKDDNDFIFVLICLTYWSIDKLPSIVYNYLDINLFTDFEFNNYENMISTTIIEDILNYIGSKFADNKTIACGAYHSVGIREENVSINTDTNADFITKSNAGTVVTWGNNEYNQREDSPSGKFIEITCGLYHSVGIRENGTVVTWVIIETNK